MTEKWSNGFEIVFALCADIAFETSSIMKLEKCGSKVGIDVVQGLTSVY